MDDSMYVLPLDAEPLHRYTKGGYHPVVLGDTLKNGRYRILHKLGWGGYSTVWAARDQREDTYAAVKISVAKNESEQENQEVHVMQTLAATQPRPQHVMRMIDDFDLMGPNGRHKCLVLDLVGPNVPEFVEPHFSDGRLPGNLAKRIANQALIGLDGLHQHKIGHGDLHTRNLTFTMPHLKDLQENKFMEALGQPKIGYVQRTDEKPLEAGVPKYIVRPAVFQSQSWLSHEIKIIDFGESFLPGSIPQTLHTPLAVRAPENIFQDSFDYRVDLWSMGCMLFELFVGQPPFDTIMKTPAILEDSFDAMPSESTEEIPGPSFQEWLEEMYFDSDRKETLSREDIVQLGEIIGRLLRFEPSSPDGHRQEIFWMTLGLTINDIRRILLHISLLFWSLLLRGQQARSQEQMPIGIDQPGSADDETDCKYNFPSPAPHIFSSVNGLLQQWANTFFPIGHGIVPCHISPFTNLYHGRQDGNMPESPEWVAFDIEMPYGIMGSERNSHILTYQTTKQIGCLYFDGESATLFGSGMMDTQMLFIYGM
uniref:non-specific serine/threonine protein kinase n=1 Tax=Talaromyces marneffei PM1 TaxID=1077442 RepID=A0A093VIB6_TALMA